MVTSNKLSSYISKAVICLILSVVGISMLYPFLNVLAQSLSGNEAIIDGSVTLFPKGFTVKGFEFLFSYSLVFRSLLNTVLYTVGGTALSITLTVFGAYAITRKHLPFKKFFTIFITFTLWFNAGIIPNYTVVSKYHLIGNPLAMVLPMAIVTYNLIVLKTFFQQVPDSLEEAALIDGANDFQIMVKVVIPLSVPGIVTIALYYAVSIWNSYIPALFYLRSKEMYPLQMLLRELVILANLQDVGAAGEGSMAVRYAAIIFAAVPVIALFPFIHRKFVSGIMAGAVKG